MELSERVEITGTDTRKFVASYPQELRPLVRKGIAASRRASSIPMWIDRLNGDEYRAAMDGYMFIACY